MDRNFVMKQLTEILVGTIISSTIYCYYVFIYYFQPVPTSAIYTVATAKKTLLADDISAE